MSKLKLRLLSQVSLRKQEIADRLNAWIIFHEKNKELCDWLTQMENKVALSSDLNIEEMVEKLKKVKTSPAFPLEPPQGGSLSPGIRNVLVLLIFRCLWSCLRFRSADV